MPPATRSSTRKQATSVPSTRPKAKAKSKAKPKAKKSSAHQVSETQPSESSARPVPKTKSKKSIAREKLLLVQSLRVKALSLMRQSNANTPISCLPVEILSAIFIEVSAAEYEAHKTTWARIHISRVSHHWRTVALSTPALWRRLVLRDSCDVPGLLKYIARSKKLMLDLRLLSVPTYARPHSWGKKDAKVLLDQLSRARSLHLDASPETSGALDWPKASKLLTHFRLSDTYFIGALSTYHRYNEFDRRQYTPLALLSHLETMFPNLQSLEIADHGVSLGDLRLPSSLVELSIVNIQAYRRDEDTTRILDVLRNLPALEQLTLTNATTKLDANALHQSRPVSLSRLKTFSFEGQISTCLAFIRSLELPRSARRVITVSNKRGTDEELIRLGNDLITEIAKWETCFSSALVNNCWGLKWLAWRQTQSVEDLEDLAPSVVQGDDHPVTKIDYRFMSSADLQIHFRDDNHALRYESLFAHVKTLVFYFHRYSSLHVSSLFTHLDELEVMSCVFKGCTRSDRDQDCFANLNEWNPPLPRLHALRLVQFAFMKKNYDPLLDLCRKRQQTGKTLDVHLLSCYEVSKSHLAKLRAVNSSVSWDGKKTGYSPWW